MEREALWEARHLEAWVVEHPEVLGEDLKVVSTQFNRWESEVGSAAERLDVLALSSSGQTVVVELKRGQSPTVHLQALTYAAMVSGFTKDVLAATHRAWLAARGEEVSQEEALTLLSEWVAGDWTDEMLAVPRILLVAESFPAQVITTIQWLANVTDDLVIEAHEYHLFRQGGGVLAAFQRLFPVDDVSDRVLRPARAQERNEVNERIAENTRRAKSTVIITDSGQVDDGVEVVLNLNTLARPEVVQLVEDWMQEDPARSAVTWRNHHSKPLVWRRPEDPSATEWTPTALRNEFVSRAGAPKQTSSAGDAWEIGGRSLYQIAESIVAQGQ
ncbi:hypothetical protein [Micrococcus aloeverae]